MTSEKSTLSSLINQDWKSVKVETDEINELLINISKKNITELMN